MCFDGVAHMMAGVSNETAMNLASTQCDPLQTWIALEARIERTPESVADGCGCHIQVHLTMHPAWHRLLPVHLGTSICVPRATCLRDTPHDMVWHAVQQLGWDTYTMI